MAEDRKIDVDDQIGGTIAVRSGAVEVGGRADQVRRGPHGIGRDRERRRIAGEQSRASFLAIAVTGLVGALVFGAFAPRKTAGFAAPSLRRLVATLRAPDEGAEPTVEQPWSGLVFRSPIQRGVQALGAFGLQMPIALHVTAVAPWLGHGVLLEQVGTHAEKFEAA